MDQRLAKTTEPLDYTTTLRIIRDAILAVKPAPVVVAEGANTMDNARFTLLSARSYNMTICGAKRSNKLERMSESSLVRQQE